MGQLLTAIFTGLSFTPEERISKNLTGLIPHTMESLQTQCARALKMVQTRSTPIDKYLYLSSLKDQNIDLFYRLVMDNIRELMPLVYTPTIGDVCIQYSSLYTRPEALYISIKQRKSIRTMLRNWPCRNPEISVVTDGSRILGLGDLGINGVGISVSRPSLVVPNDLFADQGDAFRSESSLCTLLPLVSTPRRLCPSSLTAVPTTKPTSRTLCTLVCARSAYLSRSSRSSWTSSWLLSRTCTQTW